MLLLKMIKKLGNYNFVNLPLNHVRNLSEISANIVMNLQAGGLINFIVIEVSII